MYNVVPPLRKIAEFLCTAHLRRCPELDMDPERPKSEQKWCLYSKTTGKLLGRHLTREDALRQERVIYVNK